MSLFGLKSSLKLSILNVNFMFIENWFEPSSDIRGAGD